MKKSVIESIETNAPELIIAGDIDNETLISISDALAKT
jgi:hypothetical protein